MPIAFSLSAAAPDRAKADLLAVPVFADRVLGPGADAVDRALGGGLAAFVEEAGFAGKEGETLAVPTAGRLGARAAVLVGVGERDKLTADGLRRAGAALARRASKVRSVATTLVGAGPKSIERSVAARAVVEGIVLGAYQYLAYKTGNERSKLARVALLGASGAGVRGSVDRGVAVAEAVIWARDIENTPSAEKSPAAFAEAARRLLRGRGVTVQVFDPPALRRMRMGGVLGVGQGSASPPRFVKITYAPPRARGRLALVGKGVVFDSGGLSLKTAQHMETMKSDMSGAAAVIATMSVLKSLGVKARVVGYAPMVENMPSGRAIRPGDVLTMRNRKTVEVLNTDAEGRLILADALSLAAEDKPDAIVDLATLTGACVVALGEKVAGLLGSNDGLVEQVRAAAGRAGEPVWPLPLPDEYRKQLDSEVADLKNIGGQYGGALTAGLFLHSFTGEVPWAHLDIAGPARATADDGYLTRGGTGFGVRTLIELASSFEVPPLPGAIRAARATRIAPRRGG